VENISRAKAFAMTVRTLGKVKTQLITSVPLKTMDPGVTNKVL